MNCKYYIISFVFLWLLLPFLLVSNFYPFFRYGMFAEPLRVYESEKRYVLMYYASGTERYHFNPQQIGLSPTSFSYLTRRYVAQGDTLQFFRQIRQSAPRNIRISKWELWQINYRAEGQPDSSKIYVYNE